jgi:hypothetical protein
LQTLSRIADWSSLAGVVVSAAGLVYSILAFKAAKGAEKASLAAEQRANEARLAVRTLVAADIFHYLSSRASELINHVEHGVLEVPVFLAKDLRFEINRTIARWDFLDDETKDKFREASRLAKQVAEYLRSKKQLDLQDKAKVLKKCDLILSILSGESGKIQASLESRGQQ